MLFDGARRFLFAVLVERPWSNGGRADRHGALAAADGMSVVRHVNNRFSYRGRKFVAYRSRFV